jgi:hypothetical protein
LKEIDTYGYVVTPHGTAGAIESASASYAFPGHDQRRPFMVMTNTKTAATGPGRVPRPSTAPAYYLGRPAWVWLAAFRRGSSHTKAKP